MRVGRHRPAYREERTLTVTNGTPRPPGDGAGARPATRIAVLTDSHLCPPGTAPGRWNNPLLRDRTWRLWEGALARIAALSVDAVAVLGDLTDRAEPDQATRALDQLAALGPPVAVVAGNHDLAEHGDVVGEAGRRRPRPGLHLPDLGDGPELASHRVRGVPITRTGGGAVGLAGHPDDLTVDGAAPLILLSHYPVLPTVARLTRAGLRHPDELVGAGDLADRLRARPALTLVLHGHLHAALAGASGRVLQLGLPALVEWPHAVSVVTVSPPATVERGPSVSVEIHSVLPGGPGEPDRRTVLPDPRCWVGHAGWRPDPGSGELALTWSNTRRRSAS
jgi:calcineurin-like phosphoesterase family protein